MRQSLSKNLKHFSLTFSQLRVALAFYFLSQINVTAQTFQVKTINGLTGQPLSNVLTLNQHRNLLGESNRRGQPTLDTICSEAAIFRLYGFEILEQSIRWGFFSK